MDSVIYKQLLLFEVARRERAQEVILEARGKRVEKGSDIHNLFSELTIEKDYKGFPFVVKLPNMQLPREQYVELKKYLEGIRGKWTKKAEGFVFQSDPSSHLTKFKGGEIENIQQKFQFFETPQDVATKMAKFLLMKGGRMGTILEPSAGQGALIDAVREIKPNAKFEVLELMPENKEILKNKYVSGVKLVGNNFLTLPKTKKYSMIIANPPFANDQDILHVFKMISHLKPGGRLVTIMSRGFLFKTTKIVKAFKSLVDSFQSEHEEIAGGAFKTSGTGVSTALLILNLPKKLSDEQVDLLADLENLTKAKLAKFATELVENPPAVESPPEEEGIDIETEAENLYNTLMESGDLYDLIFDKLQFFYGGNKEKYGTGSFKEGAEKIIEGIMRDFVEKKGEKAVKKIPSNLWSNVSRKIYSYIFDAGATKIMDRNLEDDIEVVAVELLNNYEAYKIVLKEVKKIKSFKKKISEEETLKRVSNAIERAARRGKFEPSREIPESNKLKLAKSVWENLIAEAKRNIDIDLL